MTIKSPFHIIEDFISPSACEKIIEQYGLIVPSCDENDAPLKYEKKILDAELSDILNGGIFDNKNKIESRYSSNIEKIASASFLQYFENPEKPCELHGCESAKYLRKKWVKVKDIDLVGYLWLKDFNSSVPLDPRYETYGGKLEFPAYDFSLVPQRGTLVLFPAGPHFITAISPILIGSLEQIKITLKFNQEEFWAYDPSKFPGSYSQWFSEHI